MGGDVTLLTDDQRARVAAGRMGIRVMGTLGVLLEARRRSIVPSIRPLLERLEATGMYLSPQIIIQVLKDAYEN
jgi:predicted nucleic acid-binding protein